MTNPLASSNFAQLIPVLVLPGTAQVLVLLVLDCRYWYCWYWVLSVYTAVLLATCIHLTSVEISEERLSHEDSDARISDDSQRRCRWSECVDAQDDRMTLDVE